MNRRFSLRRALRKENRERKCVNTMSQNGKLMPNLDQKSTRFLNLTVLQRIDPFVEEILITASHVALYEFNIDTSQWSRKDVEGALFVMKRNIQPRYQFTGMNRRSDENLVENLLGDFEYEVQVPYLLYRNASRDVNGIWFYNAQECEEIANLFSRILDEYPKVLTKSKVSATRSKFEELEAVSTVTVMGGSLEPSSFVTTNVAGVPEDQSFVNFSNPYRSSPTVVSGHSQSVTLPTLPSTRAPASSSTSPIMSILENSRSNTVMKHANDVVKPSSFFAPALIMQPKTTSVPTAPILNPPGNLQLPIGAPLLQPFPPPTPPPLLTPTSAPTPNYGPIISREKIREALQALVQDDQFIDIIYEAVRNVHES